MNCSDTTNPDIMHEYVASGAINAIKEMYSGDSNEKDMPDADMFVKAQDWDMDNLRVVKKAHGSPPTTMCN